MIRTCRILFPARNNYNVSLLNQRICQSKQISMEFSFNAEQWKDHQLQKKFNEHVKAEFSTFKENEKVTLLKNQEKKSKDTALSNYPPLITNRDTLNQKSILNEPSKKANVDLSSLPENIIPKLIKDDLGNELKANEPFVNNQSKPCLEDSITATPSKEVFNTSSAKMSYKLQEITAKDALKSLRILAKTGSREIAKMKFYSEILITSEAFLSLRDISNAFYAVARLNFANMPLLSLLSKQILQILEKSENESEPKVLISLLHSVCKLKYKNNELVECLCKNINKVQHVMQPEQTALCLFAVSNINFKTAHIDSFIRVLSELENTDFSKTRNFLNYIWASVILGKENLLPLKHVEAVLSKKFLEQLNISGDSTPLNKIKLANISGAVSRLKGYKGPLLDHLILFPVLSKSKNNFLTILRDSLSYIFPKSGFMEALSYVGSGIFTDIECCLDSSCNPVLLKDKEKNHKIGIVMLDHNDFCLDSNELTGVIAFRITALKFYGYKVLTVSHKEFPFNSPLSEKIGYLRNKLKKLINVKQ